MDLKGRNFLTLKDFTAEEITYLLDLAADLKEKKKSGVPVDHYHGKNIALIFEKTSTRTRCAFEVAAHDMGMGTTYLDPSGSQIGKKESIEDTARVLGRMFDGIEYRGFDHSYVEELINAGMLDREQGRIHPKKNVITRALGSQVATPDFFEFEAEEGYLLLCSDGLSNMISDEELKELLLDHSQIANKVNQMITRANEYGGKDNISLVIVDLKR